MYRPAKRQRRQRRENADIAPDVQHETEYDDDIQNNLNEVQSDGELEQDEANADYIGSISTRNTSSSSSSAARSSSQGSKSSTETSWETYLKECENFSTIRNSIATAKSDEQGLHQTITQLNREWTKLSKASDIDRSQWPEYLRKRFDSLISLQMKIEAYDKLILKRDNEELALQNKVNCLEQNLNDVKKKIDGLEEKYPEFRKHRLLMERAQAAAPAPYKESASSYAISGYKFEKENEGQTFCYQKEPPQSLSLMLPEIFGRLQDDLETVHYDSECHELTFEMSRAYKECDFQKESEMKSIFKHLMSQWLGDDYYRERERKRCIPKLKKLYPNDYGKILADGAVVCEPFVTAFVDFKRVLGSAYAQLIVYYVNYINAVLSGYEFRHSEAHHYMPALAIAFTGPYLTLYGLMTEFTGGKDNQAKLHAEHFTTIFICTNSNDQKRIQTLTNFYASVRKALDRLKQFYSSENKETLVTVENPFHFLYPKVEHFYLNGDRSSPCKLEYISRINFGMDNADNRMRYMFKVKCVGADASKKWIAKFFIPGPHAESVAVHWYCAQNGYAPALLGWRRLKAGWWLIVMEDLRDTFTRLPKPIPRETLQAIRTAREYLHAEQRVDESIVFRYVHGDFRPANVLVHKKDPTKIMIVDFDWAGKQGVVRFPITMWPKAVSHGGRPLALIEQEHDEYYFTRE